MRALLCLALLTFAPMIVAAEEIYTLKIPIKPKAGERLRGRKVVINNHENSITTSDGQVLQEEKKNESTERVTVETIVTQEKDKKPTKSIITFEKAIRTVDGNKTSPDLVGKTVTVEYNGLTPSFKFEDGTEPTGDTLDFLKSASRRQVETYQQFEKVVFPKKPVKVGESWSADKDELARQIKASNLPVTINPDTIKGTCKLLKVYDKDGRTFGVLDIDLSLAIQAIGPEGQAIKMNPGSVWEIKGKMDVAIDGGRECGTTDMNLSIKANGKATAPDGQEFNVKINATNNEIDTIEPLPNQ